MVEREGEEGVLHYDLDLQCISQILVSKLVNVTSTPKAFI